MTCANGSGGEAEWKGEGKRGGQRALRWQTALSDPACLPPSLPRTKYWQKVSENICILLPLPCPVPILYEYIVPFVLVLGYLVPMYTAPLPPLF